MDAKLSEKVFLFSNKQLPREQVPELFEELIATGEIWNLPDLLDTAGMLLDAGQIGPDAKKKRIRSLDG